MCVWPARRGAKHRPIPDPARREKPRASTTTPRLNGLTTGIQGHHPHLNTLLPGHSLTHYQLDRSDHEHPLLHHPCRSSSTTWKELRKKKKVSFRWIASQILSHERLCQSELLFCCYSLRWGESPPPECFSIFLITDRWEGEKTQSEHEREPRLVL
jgi:hypothetical protein